MLYLGSLQLLLELDDLRVQLGLSLRDLDNLFVQLDHLARFPALDVANLPLERVLLFVRLGQERKLAAALFR